MDADRPFHSLHHAEAFSALGSSPSGLSSEEAAHRLALHGPNVFASRKKPTALARFLSQFNNPLIYVLLASAAASLALGHGSDSAVIFGVVFINAAIGFLQEGKAEKALDAIRKTLAPTAVALRDGARATVDAATLVPGDVVFLRPGDRVGADLRLFSALELSADEAPLTGESEPAEKATDPVDSRAPVGDRAGMAHAGTLIVTGQGAGVVCATGRATEIGRIGALLDETEGTTTPLLQKMAGLGKSLALWTLLLSAAAFALGYWWRGYPAGEAFMAAVGIAVAAIPEGLPAILTIALAVGVRRMAARNAIIRRLPAVEALGAVTLICSDKTGTFTRGEMTVAVARAAEGTGEAELYRAAALCSEGVHSKSPTEAALLAAARGAGIDPEAAHAESPQADALPFNSERKFMATAHDGPEGRYLLVKGAPERVLAHCAHGPRTDGMLKAAHELAAQGMRVIAVARGGDPGGKLAAENLMGLAPLGLFGLMDPPREEAAVAVAACLKAGIRVVMITGDHGATGLTIAGRLGIPGEKAMTGPEIEATPDAELAAKAADVNVFARSSPEHKLRLVTAFQAEGHVVAMTGDGVNDAPALKRADIGIAMGIKGTEAAKEASQMVLADDNFATIAAAVAEGRAVYDNLVKSIVFVLPTNVAEGLIILCAILAGVELPILPVQILWINMVGAVTLALALAFEPAEAGVMERRPRNPAEPLLTPFLLWRLGFVSLISLAGSFGPFLYEAARHANPEYARTVAVNSLVVIQCFYLVNARRLTAPSLGLGFLLGNRVALLVTGILLLLQAAFTYLPFMNALFGTAPLDWQAWARIAAAAFGAFWLVEIEKWAIRRWNDIKTMGVGT